MAEQAIHAQPPSREGSGSQTAKKRSRVQFSCTACRDRKLKCDRTYPCDRCTRRGDAASCTFVGHGPRGRATRGGSSPTHIQNRIQHLENLVLSFAQQKRQEDPTIPPYPTSFRKSNGRSLADLEGHVEDEPIDSSSFTEASQIGKILEDNPGKIVNEHDVGTSYVDASHWRAILDDIKEVKEYLRDDDVSSELSDEETDEMDDSSRPSLLFGLGRAPSKNELLADLPQRQVVDRLLARLLNSGDPMLVILHFPTFQRECAQFWLNPGDVSVPWLGLLYACLTMSVHLYLRCGEPLPTPLTDPYETMILFRRRCCHCLIHSNYTKPGRYKVEALMMYAAAEYTKKGNAPVSVSMILGIVIKLAMRMGYHRDSKYYSNISALEGEMRRRLWAVICQLDTLTSFQIGVPKLTQSWQSDTELPRNIFDEDIDENTIELPPSQPESVRTPVTYAISKARLMSVFGRVSDLAFSRKPTSYEEVLELDRRLEEAHESTAPPFRMRPMDQSITDDPNLIMKRYTLDVLYQKTRVVLHRKFLTEGRSDVRHNYSRWVCVHAAKEILHHQADLFHESQRGGRLVRDRWFFNSLQNHDFVLAAMVICLELSKNKPSEARTRQHGFGFSVVLEGRDGLLKALETSRDIWETNLQHSIEARNAFLALTIMLKKAQDEDHDGTEATRPQSDHDQHLTPSSATANLTSSDDICMGESASTMGRRAPISNGGRDSDSSPSFRIISTPATSIGSSSNNANNNGRISMPPPQTTTTTTQPAALGMIETMIDAPSNFDWHVWDGHMQEFEPGMTEPYWGPDPLAAAAAVSGMSMQASDHDMLQYHPMQPR